MGVGSDPIDRGSAHSQTCPVLSAPVDLEACGSTVCMACRTLQPLQDESSYVVCALARDSAGNTQKAVSARAFATPDGAPPVILLSAAAPRTAQPALTGVSSDAVFSQSGTWFVKCMSIPRSILSFCSMHDRSITWHSSNGISSSKPVHCTCVSHSKGARLNV